MPWIDLAVQWISFSEEYGRTINNIKQLRKAVL